MNDAAVRPEAIAPAADDDAYTQTSRRASSLLIGLSLLLTLCAIAALCIGAAELSPSQMLSSLMRGVSGETGPLEDTIVLQLRLPRVLMAMLLGAGLAMGGAVMQGLFRNPLADPGLIGVSAGASLGAVATIVLGPALWLQIGSGADYGIAVGAFIGGLIAALLVWLIGRRRAGVATLLLAGVAINAIALAGVGWLTYVADDRQLRDLTFWSLSSVGGITWTRLMIAASLCAIPLLWLPRCAHALNALLLGEDEAAFLGFRPERLQIALIFLAALLVSASVAFTGVVGFVGLVVPHLLRLVFGPDHRLLLPACGLGGAALVIAADTLARTAVAPAELPLGVLTALVGGPFFLWLLLRTPIAEER